MRAHRAARVALVAALACGGVVAPPNPPASALFHLMMVTEVLAGTSISPDAQFIELQMHAPDQRFLTGHEVAVFDPTGAEVAAFTFTGPVANGADQAFVLLATEQAETAFGVTADLAMTSVVPAQGGSVCFRSADGGIIDCAAWGSYSGDPAHSGTPFNAALGLLPGRSMERVTSGGNDPQKLDPADDTNDSESDFDEADPSPTNNAGGAAEPEPGDVEHSRSLSLALRRSLVARGKMSAEGDYAACFRDARVKIQRRRSGTWKVIARTTTGSYGSYRVKLRDRPGRYRAVAPRFSPSDGHRCLKAISPIRRNR